MIRRGWTIAIAVISNLPPILVRSLHLLVYITKIQFSSTFLYRRPSNVVAIRVHLGEHEQACLQQTEQQILLSHEDPSGDRQSKSCHGTGNCKEDRTRSGAQRAGKCEVSVQALESSATVPGGFRMARNPEATLDRHPFDSP